MQQMLSDGELFISLSFNPNEASNAIIKGDLPDTVRTYVHQKGTIGNAHFVAIPFNARAKAAAKVVANFLLSPKAQLKKADVNVWGDLTVLSMAKLSTQAHDLFKALPAGIATLAADQLGHVLPEPHSSWVKAIEHHWLMRYSR